MSTRTPRSASGPSRGAEGTAVPLSEIPLLDAEGTRIPLVESRVEQIAVDEAHGALASRLHQQGEVIGRDRDLVYVRFEYHLTSLPPGLVRLVPKVR